MYIYKVERKPQMYGLNLNSIPCGILYECCLSNNRITASKCITERKQEPVKKAGRLSSRHCLFVANTGSFCFFTLFNFFLQLLLSTSHTT